MKRDRLKFKILILFSLLFVIGISFALAKYVIFTEQKVTVTLKDATIAETQITVSPSAWTNNKVSVTIESEKGGQIYYKIGENGSWNKYSNSFDMFENDKVFSKLVFEDANGPETLKDVTNIDKIPPTTKAPTATKTSNKIIVTSKQEDFESGIVYEEYAIKKDGIWYTQQLNNFEGLKCNTTYEVKTISQDLAGNRMESDVLEVTTDNMTPGELTFKKDTSKGEILNVATSPDDEKVYINSNVYFELAQGENGKSTYIVEKDNSEVTLKNNLLTTETGTYEVTMTTTDGTNTIEQKYYIYVDKNPPTKVAPNAESTSGKIKLTNNQTDSESGVHKIEYGIYNEKQSEWIWQDNDTFTELSPDKEYRAKTRATDNAGNQSESDETIVKTKELISAAISIKENDENKREITASKSSDDENKDWTNKDILIDVKTSGSGKAEVTLKDKNGNEVTKNSDGSYTTDDGTYEITVKITDSDNNVKEDKYYIFVDKTKPTLTLNPNGKEYIITPGNTTTTISVNAVAEDAGSGIAKTEFAWSNSNTVTPTVFEEFTNSSTIEKNVSGGTYYLWTKIVDKAGNISDQLVSNKYSVKYQIVYNANGGQNAPSAQLKEQGTDIKLTTNKPTKTGYGFLGWAKSSTATKFDYAAGSTYSSDEAIMLYAVWNANTYNIKYNTNGGTFDTTPESTYTYGKAQSLPVPKKEGYTFDGWYKDEGFTTKIDKINSTEIGDLNLYANYTANKYTIIYNGNGQTSGSVASQQVEYDQNVTIAQNGFVKTGYTFKEWNTQKDGTGNKYLPGDVTKQLISTNNGTITLFAIWTDNTPPTKTAPGATATVSSVTVTCKQTDNGTGIDESTIEYGIYKDGKWNWQKDSTFTGLNSDMEYEVKTRVSDKGGNGPTESDSTKIKTEVLAQGDLIFKKDSSTGVVFVPTTDETSEKSWINNDVYIEIKKSENGETSFDVLNPSGVKNTYKENSVIVTDSGKYTVTVKTKTDAEETSKTYYIYIDKEKPTTTLPTATSTTGKIVVKSNQVDTISGIAKVEYGILKDGAWKWQTTNVFSGLTENTQYEVRTRTTDNAGNFSETESTIIATKELEPNEVKITGSESGDTITPSKTKDDSNKDWTNEDVKVTITTKEGTTSEKHVYKEDGTEVNEDADGNYGVDDGTYTVVIITKDTDGNTKKETYYIFVDKTKPVVTVVPDGGKYVIPVGSTNAKIDATINIAEDGSGVQSAQYAWSSSQVVIPTTWIDFSSGKAISNSVKGGNYYLWIKVKDKAGNIADKGITNVYKVVYSVEYNANGGSNAPTKQEKTSGTNLTLSKSLPVKTGYTFKGWAENQSATTAKYQAGDTYSVDASIRLYAVWEANTYNIIYNLNGGKFNETQDATYTYNQEKVLPTADDITKAGYEFDGWYNKDGNKMTTLPAGTIDNITLDAKWTARSDTAYTVNYYLENANNTDYSLNSTETRTGTTDTVITLDDVKNPKVAISNATYAKTSLTSTTKIDAVNKTVVNVYYNRNKYTVTLTAGNNISSVTGAGSYKWGQNVSINAIIQSLAGYTYTWGKWTSSNSSVLANQSKQSTTFVMPAANITLEANASRTIIEYVITKKVKVDDVINNNKTQEIKYNVETESFDLTKEDIEGYTFKGWTLNDETQLYETVTIKKGTTGNKTYTANYKDETPPTTTAPTGVSTTNVINLTCTQTDSGSGIDESTIEYGMYIDGAWKWQSSSTFEGLSANTDYRAKTRVKDNSANGPTESAEAIIKTKSVNDASLIFRKNNSTGTIIDFPTTDDSNVWVNTNVHITVKSSESQGVTTTYKIVDSNGNTQTLDEDGILTTTTGKYIATVTTTDGKNTKTNTYYIYIDKDLPTVSITPNGGEYLIPVGSQTTTVTPTLKAQDNGGSNLNTLQYGWSTSNTTQPSNWSTFTNNAQISKTLNSGNNYLWTKVTDNAGNVATNVAISKNFKVGYTVEFDANGGQNAPSSQRKEKDYNLTISSTIPTKTGYTFKGWAETASATSAKYQAGGTYSANSSIKLYAVWQANTYNITYNLNGGSFNKTEETKYTYNEEKVLPTSSDITKAGYDFNGWYNESETKITSISAGTIGDITLEARWTARTDTKYVVYHYVENIDDNNYTLNSTDSTKTGTTDSTITLADLKKTITGATYKQGSITANGTAVTTTTLKGDGTTKIYLYYSRNTYTLSVKGNENIQKTVGSGTYKYGKKISVSAEVKDLPGYTYVWTGWTSTDITAPTSKDSTVVMPAMNATITANASRTIKEYSIEYNLNDGSLGQDVTNPTTYTVESENITLNNPTKSGYAFSGWTEQIKNFEWKKGFIEYDTGEVTSNSTYPNSYYTNYIYLEAGKTYTISGNGTYSDVRFRVYGTDLKYIGNGSEKISYKATQNCYVRIVYYNAPTTEQMSASILTSDIKDTTEIISKGSTNDRAYTANWGVNNYKVTYDYATNGGTSATKTAEEVKYGSKIDLTPTATKSGYVFVGWNTNKNATTGLSTLTMQDSAVTLYAIYSKEVTVLYDKNGGAEDITQKYTIYNNQTNLTITTPSAATTKTGWTFIGFGNSSSATSGYALEKNVDITIAISANSYTLYTNWKKDIEVKFIDYKGTTKTTTTKNITAYNGGTADVVAPQQNEYTNWTRKGWTTLTTTTATGSNINGGKYTGLSVNTVYYGLYEQTVTITYNLNGATSAQIDSQNGIRKVNSSNIASVSNPKLTITSTIPTKPGYTFKNWKDSSENVYESGTSYTIFESKTLNAVWDVITYNITYDLNGGSLETGKTNPTTYTVESDDITLNNPIKVGYNFSGWQLDGQESAQNPCVISKGSIGDRKYIAKWANADDIEYKIEYYYQTNGAYTTKPNTIIKYGTTGEAITLTEDEKKPEKTGYVFDEGNTNNVTSGYVIADGSLVLKVYFKQQFTVIYQKGDKGTFATQTYSNLDYNATTPAFSGSTTGAAGYTFNGWIPEVGEKVTDNATYTAKWKANTNTKYTVEYYYQQQGEYPTTATNVKECEGTTDTTITLSSGDKTPTSDGYIYDENANNVTTGKIAGDGSLVLKVYFKQQFTITYKAGKNVKFNDEVHSGLSYGELRPVFEGTAVYDAGYSNGVWSPKLEGTVTSNVVYTLNATANTNTKYKVEYYYQESGRYSATPTSFDETRTGTTDTSVTIKDSDKVSTKSGYVFDSDNANNILSGNVNGDGSLVLKLYFKQQFTVKYVKGDKGTFNEETYSNLDYGTKTPAFAGNTTGTAGYSFNGWNPTVATIVTSDITYTAKWKANENTDYKIEYYKQSASNGQYSSTPTETDTSRTGTTDTIVDITEEVNNNIPAGYALDNSKQNILSGNIAGDGSLTLRVYYKLQFTVTYKAGQNVTFKDDIHQNLDYGAETPKFAGTPVYASGYGNGTWTPALATTVTANATYTLNATANTNVKYTVEYYYQENGKYPDTPTSSDATRTGETNKTVSVTEADKQSTKTGYVFDSTNTNNVLSGKVLGDGSLKLKVYFKQHFTVKYVKGDKGTFTEETYSNLDYGTATPKFSGEKTGVDGYSFSNWNPTVAETVTGDITYTAIWTANTNTKYTVHIYGENAEDTEYSLIKDVTKTGTTDSTVKVSDIADSITGFGKDSITAKDKLNGTTITTFKISGDGKTEIYMYYSRNTYTLTLAKGNNIKSVSGAGTYKWGKSVKISAVINSDSGNTYTWLNWKSSNVSLVEDQSEQNATIIMPIVPENETLTLTANASANANEYSITYKNVEGVDNSQNPSTYVYGNSVTFKNPGSKTGYTFDGWYTDAEFKTKTTGITSTQKSNVTVYAKWNINKYTVTYNALGGTCEIGVLNDVEYGSDIDVTTIKASKPNYVFKGWNTDQKATTPLTSLKMGTSDIVLYAIYVDAVAQIGSEYYETLQSAIDAAGKSSTAITITMLKSVTTTGATGNVAEGQNIKLDLNGMTIQSSDTTTILNNGTLQITGEGSVIGLNGDAIYNYSEGTVNVINGTINATGRAVYNAGGIINISGGKLVSTGSNTIVNGANLTGTITISGGIIDNTATDDEARPCLINYKGNVVIKGNANINSMYARTVLQYTGDGTIDIQGGTITNSSTTQNASCYAVGAESGTVKIRGGTISSKVANAVKLTGGTINISGGTISTSNGTAISCNSSSDKLNISGGTITTTSGAGISMGYGALTLTGGTVKGSSYGIWTSNVNKPTVTIGENDGQVSVTTPSIISTNGIGLYIQSGAICNFYDGKIQGPVGASISGSVTAKPNGYVVVKSNDGTTETATLGSSSPAIIANEVNKTTSAVVSVYESDTWTNNNVQIKLQSENVGAGIKEYQFKIGKSGTWTAKGVTTSSNSGTMTISTDMNDTIYFRAVDNNGIISEESSIIVKRDTVNPTNCLAEKQYNAFPNNTYSVLNATMDSNYNVKTTSSNPRIILSNVGRYTKTTAIIIKFKTAVSDIGSIQVFYGNTNSFTEQNSRIIESSQVTGKKEVRVEIPEGAYNYIRCDIGNKLGVSYQLSGIYFVTKSDLWNNGSIRVKLSSTDTQSGVKGYQWYSGGWKTSPITMNNGEGFIEFTDKMNATVKFKSIDNADNGSTFTTPIKIDLTAPTVKLVNDGGTYNIAVGATTASISSKITVSDVGGSEIKTLQYAWSQSNETQPTVWSTFTNGTTVSKNATGGSWYLWTQVIDNAGNKKVSASKEFKVNYQIVYDANGGNGAPATQVKAYGTNITLNSTKPTKQGYTFKGWGSSNTSTTVEYKAGAVYSKNASIKLYAIWEGTVTFDKNYFDTELTNDTYKTDSWKYTTTKYTDVKSVTDSSAKFGEHAEITMDKSTASVPNGPYYNITALTSGKTYTWSVFVKSNSNRTMQIGHAQDGYKEFNVTTEWQKLTYTFTASSYPSHVFMFYLQSGAWAEGDKLYVHSLEIMEGTPTTTSSTKIINSTLGALSVPTREGYTFQGWYTKPSGGTKVSPTTVVKGNATYYAHWACKATVITYNFNGGNNMNAWSYTYPERFTNTYDSTTGLTDVKVAGGFNWEIAYLPIATTVGKKYTVAFDYQIPQAYETLSGYSGVGYQALTKVEKSSNSANQIAVGYLPATAQTTKTRAKLTFTATTTTTYFAYNFGMAADDKTAEIKLGNFEISEETLYGQQLERFPSPMCGGKIFDGWYTSATGGTKITVSDIVPAVNTTYYAHWVDAVARIGTSTDEKAGDKFFKTLQYAINNAATSGDKIYMLKSQELSGTVGTIPSGKTIELNLNKFTISTTSTTAPTLVNSGILTVTGGKISGSYRGIHNKSSGKLTILTNSAAGVLTINTTQEAIYNEGTSSTSSSPSVHVSMGATLTSKSAITFKNASTGYVLIEDATLTNGLKNVVQNSSTGTISIGKSTIKQTNEVNSAIGNSTTGKIIVANVAIDSAGNGIYNVGSGIIEVASAELTITAKKYGIYGNTGTVTIGNDDSSYNYNVIIKGDVTGVKMESGGTLNFYDGKIKGKPGMSIVGNTIVKPDGYDIYKSVDNDEIETSELRAAHTLTVDPNGGKYNNSTNVTTVSGTEGSTTKVPNPTRSQYTVTYNYNGSGVANTSAVAKNTFVNWTLTGDGNYKSGVNVDDIASSYTKTQKTETAGSYINFTNRISTAPTSSQWKFIRYPTYTYTSGHTYMIKAKYRINQMISGASINIRHAAFVNDYGSTGLVIKQNITSTNNAWKEIYMTRTFTGTTVKLGSTDKTIEPYFEIATSDLKGKTGTIDFDIKDVEIIDITDNTIIESQNSSYMFGTKDSKLTANWTDQTVTLPTPTRSGYSFKGWYKEAACKNKVGDGGAVYTPTANITLYAKWRKNNYQNYDKGTYYQTLQEAVDDLSTNTQDNVLVLTNVTETGNINVVSDKKMILNTKGHTVTITGGGIVNKGAILLNGPGKLTGSGEAPTVSNSGNFSTGGNITLESTSTNYALSNTGEALISSGLVKSANAAIQNTGTGRLRVWSSANIEAESSAIINSSTYVTTDFSRSVMINAGEQNTYHDPDSSPNVIKVGNAKAILNESSGDVYIGNTNITSEDTCVRNNGTGNIEILGGTFTASGGSGVMNTGTGKVTLNGRYQKISITGKTFGICSTAKTTIDIHTYTGSNHSINIEATGGTGIHNSQGTLNLGVSNPGTDNITIKGTTYGVNNPSTGTFKYYDGIITGPLNKAINGTITFRSGYTKKVTNTSTTTTVSLVAK